jgi:hypothetical protein
MRDPDNGNSDEDLWKLAIVAAFSGIAGWFIGVLGQRRHQVFDQHDRAAHRKHQSSEKEDHIAQTASIRAENRPVCDPKPSPKKRWYKSRQFWKEFRDWMTMFFVIVAACVYFFQWKAGKQQGDAEEGQLVAMQKQFTLDERAWIDPSLTTRIYTVYPTNVFIPLPFHYILHFKNTGKTPAVHVMGAAGLTTNLASIPRLVDPPRNFSTLILFPTDESQIETAPLMTDLAILSGQITVYLYGKIWYDDIFGRPHWITFCKVVDWERSFTFPAQTGNDCDSETNNAK